MLAFDVSSRIVMCAFCAGARVSNQTAGAALQSYQPTEALQIPCATLNRRDTMPVTENLAVQMHQQDTDYYCGAACAQMVLETIGAGLLDQDDLYADNHSHSTLDAGVNWATGPDGLQWTLMDRRPPAFTNYFALYALDTEDLISRKMCWTIHHYQVAPIALVYGWAHWIIGARLHRERASCQLGGQQLYDRRLRHQQPVAAAPELRHAGPCTAAAAQRRRWLRHRRRPRHRQRARDVRDLAIDVHDRRARRPLERQVCRRLRSGAAGPARRPAARSAEAARQGRTARTKAVAEFAVAGLKRVRPVRAQGLGRRRCAKPRHNPVCWCSASTGSTAYYVLVPFETSRGTVAFAAVDGRWGDYMQAVLLPKPQSARSRLTLEQAFKLIVGKRVDLGGRKGRLLVRKEAVCMYPHLVWRPCLESLSPYYPFYMFTVGNDRIYVRIDGAVFASLTLDMKGI